MVKLIPWQANRLLPTCTYTDDIEETWTNFTNIFWLYVKNIGQLVQTNFA